MNAKQTLESHRAYMKKMFAEMKVEEVSTDFIASLYATEAYLLARELK